MACVNVMLYYYIFYFFLYVVLIAKHIIIYFTSSFMLYWLQSILDFFSRKGPYKIPIIIMLKEVRRV